MPCKFPLNAQLLFSWPDVAPPPPSCCCPPLCLLATHATVQQMNEVSLSLCVVICRRFVAAAAAGAIRTSMRVGSSETDPNLPERSLRLPRQESRHQQQR